MRSFALALLVWTLCAACQQDAATPRDAANDLLTDAVTLTDSVTDAATDAAPVDVAPTRVEVPPYTCRPCLHDDACGPGGACVPVDPMRAPGMRECHMACDTVGAACEADTPATCVIDRQGRALCTPTDTIGCFAMSSRRNTACPAGGCAGRYHVCADLDASPVSETRGGTVCLGPCATDADCEDGARRCVEVTTRDRQRTRVCVPDPLIGPDGCGARALDATGLNAPCGGDAGVCPSGAECLADLDPGVRGFCSRACTTDTECGPSARCADVTGHGRRCVPTYCACATSPRGALLDRALAADPMAPKTRCDLFFRRDSLDAIGASVSRDRFRLPVFEAVHRDWMRGAQWSRDVGPALDARSGALSTSLAALVGVRRDGDPTQPTATPAPDVTGDTALVDAMLAVFEAAGATADRAAIEADARDVPADLQRAVARVLRAEIVAARDRDAGLSRYDVDGRARLFQVAPFLVLPTNRPTEQPDFTSDLELGALLGEYTPPTDGALTLAATVEAVTWRAFAGRMGVSFSQDTPWGMVVIHDAADTAWNAADLPRLLLSLDLGGDDTYTAPVAANVDVAQPVSVSIDVGGNDRYGYVERPSSFDTPETLPSDAEGRVRTGAPVGASMSRAARQGAARLGVALLYDLGAGRDTYRALRMAQGFAAFGVAGLYDDGGDDAYTVESGGQGAAIAGVAALVDAGGDDTYTTWAFAEGFAYVQGVGMLYDAAGNDRYDSKVTPVIYGSPQDAMSNSSFTQGAGFGRRADTTTDRNNMSGGVGILRDRAGNDAYSAGVFAQGTGYWGSVGLLTDGAGDDHYDARWYVQGAAAHFAVGVLVDGGGRDEHNMAATRENMTAGAGHDFSLGMLLAYGTESDTYRVPNLALGAGNANGAGIFVDVGGDDRYEAASSLTLGSAALEMVDDMFRMPRPTTGIFVDGAGDDTYVRTELGPVANERAWAQRIHPTAPTETGRGADGHDAPTGF